MDTKQLTYVGIGRLEDFEERIGRVVRIGGEEIAVFRTTEGRIFALENRSPGPRGGTLADGIVSGAVLFDPICDWRIGLADGVVLAPDTGQVRTYPVQIEDGEVRIGRNPA
ncbi:MULTISPECIES: nitrite reductase (NAD(P)H) small subunit [Paenibacillus]|uniref:nitrite reductase (NAD(P)H) small subunit n=1 Tax=Paenibacillus TaxID=44249 RepID=UPI0022B86AC3|nr:nitrite reductase (NAD(P)H) small subunit [Paenibacillus caseinilyticus]MCZ8518173.1 nitrite reductase (NAD(P)H) small subunit [Paenibacillus caseinilyticus]